MRGVIDQTLTVLLALMSEANASQVCSQCGFSTLRFPSLSAVLGKFIHKLDEGLKIHMSTL